MRSLTAAVFAWLTVALPRPAATPESLFVQYSGKEYDSVAQTLALELKSPSDVARFRSALDKGLQSWPGHHATAFALEVAAGAYPVDSLQAVRILELACRRFRRETPSVFEHQWQRAAVALLRMPPRNADMPGTWRRGFGEHLEHALTRFPDDDEFLLTRGLVREAPVYWWMYVRRIVVMDPSRSIATAVIGDSGTAAVRTAAETHRDNEGADVQRAIEAFEPLRNRPSPVRAEALLHLGMLRSYRGDFDESLALWSAAVDASESPRERYLGQLFAGRVLSDRGRPQEALNALQRARALIPTAQSAKVAVAALLYLRNDRGAAAALAEEVLRDRRQSRDDPWASYLDPPALVSLEWSGALQQLRERLQ